jgi:serine/tyrosine/threonine adenylyltransferase
VKSFGLPFDENVEKKLAQVRGKNYSKVKPTPLEQVRIVSLSKPAMDWLGMPIPTSAEEKQGLAERLSGNELFEGSDPFAHCYCGHQFGHFSGQLGDGRAISLGDIRTPGGDIVDLQLKGAGLTPYSRSADGRAVLRSSIREYLCSEAMYALGVPTTRAASLTVAATTVARDKLYTGNVKYEKCSVVMRLAPTFMRFGSFEIFKEKDP